MKARLPFITIVAFLLSFAAACGGSSEKGGFSFQPGSLTDPRSVPTATPWASPPPVIYQDSAHSGNNGGGAQPGPSGSPSASGQCGSKYKVQSGDFPMAIANKCGVTLESLMAANPGINPNNLQVGQELNIPQR